MAWSETGLGCGHVAILPAERKQELRVCFRGTKSGAGAREPWRKFAAFFGPHSYLRSNGKRPMAVAFSWIERVRPATAGLLRRCACTICYARLRDWLGRTWRQFSRLPSASSSTTAGLPGLQAVVQSGTVTALPTKRAATSSDGPSTLSYRAWRRNARATVCRLFFLSVPSRCLISCIFCKRGLGRPSRQAGFSLPPPFPRRLTHRQGRDRNGTCRLVSVAPPDPELGARNAGSPPDH